MPASLPLLKLESPPVCCEQCNRPWRTQADASKCCNPNWRRMQRVYKAVTGFGIEYGEFTWVEVEPPKDPKSKRRLP